MVTARGLTVFMLHPHSLSSIENQASSSSYLVDESNDDGNDRDLMQSVFSLNYSSNSGIGFICRCTFLISLLVYNRYSCTCSCLSAHMAV